MRLACLYVPDFPLAAFLRAEPELCGTAVAVADGQGPRGKILAVSAAAARCGVTAGLTAAQAKAIAAHLVVRAVSPDTLRAAQAALCDAAESFSPRVEDAGGGLAYLDLEGLGALFDSEAQLANAVARRAAQLGVEAHVGVAGSKVAACLAARHGGGVTVIPAGEEWHFLAPVPIQLLEPSADLTVTLQRWGIRRIGDLAALPVRAVGTRLGPEGVMLVRRARGEDECPLVPRPAPLLFEEGVECDYGIDTLEPLLFVLRGLLERLTTRLTVRGFLCGDLRLSLRLATRGRDERTVTVAAPSNEVKSLLALVRLQLETHPPVAAIEGLRVHALPERLRAAQLDLFRPNGPAPARLAVTLARLHALCGADRVGVPVVADTHRPEAYGMAGLAVSAAVNSQQSIVDSRPPELSTINYRLSASILPLALRAVRPPRAVEVFCERDRPEFVRGEGLAGRVVQAAGPWRIQGDWWHDTGYARDYYDAQLSDGGVYRLYCDLATQRWFVDGIYD
ncbi:MAG: polymerase IV-like protein ImuB [Deltaproteobacteria bacterium]|jgi:protein ImuB|nr:polymerase IV-like protein ImuB [Deltaproteobacteria bacterium]